jgi:hypothetical protein
VSRAGAQPARPGARSNTWRHAQWCNATMTRAPPYPHRGYLSLRGRRHDRQGTARRDGRAQRAGGNAPPDRARLPRASGAGAERANSGVVAGGLAAAATPTRAAGGATRGWTLGKPISPVDLGLFFRQMAPCSTPGSRSGRRFLTLPRARRTRGWRRRPAKWRRR